MKNPTLRGQQRGMALVASLLLLLVITILGVAMFRSYGYQQAVAGNTRDKERAFHAAMAAQAYAELWLTDNNGAHATVGTPCTANANANNGGTMVCSNLIQTDVKDVPWPISTSYTPPNMNSAATGSYSQSPNFYISYLTTTPAQGYQGPAGISFNIYQIDAAGYGGSPNSIAVVESTYAVQSTKTSEPPPSGQSQVTKNINLGGP